ncbi:ABC-F family ATP-binding cassette domain-containing protein [Pedobacter nutrimenti]|uniref:ABC-F family ATP-binding cassette domain-containing protein n=1 Tax=Pedobacter nutrimenti TaxID=1241337 RepID=UPI002931811A|nr:ABC-F family ATP-binding cassette domain-containing protein [Pedobacter nutrimenti]
MLNLHNITYTHPDGDVLFSGLNFIVNKQDKVALIGSNGTGKSTLLNILARNLQPASGLVKAEGGIYHVPQLFGQFNNLSIAQALQVQDKLYAFKEILDGRATEEHMALLDDDWGIEDRCKQALAHWNLENLELSQKMAALSGGQKAKIFLAGIDICKPEIVLLDEPSNHLDLVSRTMLYDYIMLAKQTLIVVSHDRILLNLLNKMYELSHSGVRIYGGNYDFYTAQKKIENEALAHDLHSKEKALRKAKETERASLERQQKLDARGKKKQEKAGMPKILLNTFKNKAEKSTSQMKEIHAEKTGLISREIVQLREALPDTGRMKIDLDHSALHKGKVLVDAKSVNFTYHESPLWKQVLNFQVVSGDRIALKGANGSGKTSLIKLILGDLQPHTGVMSTVVTRTVYIDQEYSLIDAGLSVYEQAQWYNSDRLQEHEVKIRLNRFLFSRDDWDKKCGTLSGGEKMRLMLCILVLNHRAPDMIILDEPTNNLDIQNMEILTEAINEYQGTLLVVSHDEYFLKQINVENSITLS